MNRFSKVMISGVIIGGLLSACGTQTEKVDQTPEKHTAAHETENKKESVTAAKKSVTGDYYNITFNGAEFYNPTEVDKIDSKNDRYVLVNTTVQNVKKDGQAIAPIDLKFTLKDNKTGKEYEQKGYLKGTGNEVSPWGDVYDVLLQKDQSLTGEVSFEVPKGSDKQDYTLYVDSLDEDHNDGGQWKIDTIKKSKF